MFAVCSGVTVCTHTVAVVFMATVFTATSVYRAVPIAFDLALGAGVRTTLAHAAPSVAAAMLTALYAKAWVVVLALGAGVRTTLAHAAPGVAAAMLTA